MLKKNLKPSDMDSEVVYLPKKEDSYMIDIGSNITNKNILKDFDGVMERSRKAKVNKQIITGTDLKNSIQSVNLANKYPDQLYATIGVHPHNAKYFDQKTQEKFEFLLKNKKNNIVSIGETGLDYFRMRSPKEDQIRSFKAHIDLAMRYNLPLFLHERDAYKDFLDTIKEFLKENNKEWEDLPKMIIHCFTGTQHELTEYIQLGFYIGITGFIGMGRGKYLHSFIKKELPLDRLMIETDCPYMKPQNAPNQPTGSNEPCNLAYINKILADLYGISPEKMMDITTKNTLKVFNITN